MRGVRLLATAIAISGLMLGGATIVHAGLFPPTDPLPPLYVDRPAGVEAHDGDGAVRDSAADLEREDR